MRRFEFLLRRRRFEDELDEELRSVTDRRDQLARANVVHSRKSQPIQRVVDGLALRIEDPWLQGDENARFHGSPRL